MTTENSHPFWRTQFGGLRPCMRCSEKTVGRTIEQTGRSKRRTVKPICEACHREVYAPKPSPPQGGDGHWWGGNPHAAEGPGHFPEDGQ